jgi:membrane protease YdiL (CAAX protease family)
MQTRNSTREWAVLAFACVLPSVVTVLYYVVAPQFGASPAVVQMVYGAAKAVQFALPLFWVYAICHEPLRWARWNSRGVGMGLAFGAVVAAGIWFGFQLIMSGTASFAAATEQVRDKVADVGINQPLKFVLVGVFYTLAHSLLEEYYWRWFVFGRLRYLMPLWAAIVVSSAGFMAHHVILLGIFFGIDSPLTWIFSLSIMFGGAVWAWLYQRSGNLWGPWLSHALIDAALFAVGYRLSFG